MDALQDIFSVREMYAARHDIVYNISKTEYTVVPSSL